MPNRGIKRKPAGSTCTCVQVTCDRYSIAGDRYGMTHATPYFRPTKIYPKRPPPMTERPVLTIQKPTFPVPSTSNIRPLRPPYPQVALRTQIRCFQCNSPLHIKWYCNEYRCKSCKKIAPGHSYKDCPKEYRLFDNGTWGYFDIKGDDGNLGGEC